MRQPPKWAIRFLRWYCREDYLEEIEGDLRELYELRCAESPRKADAQLVWNVVRSFRPSNIREFELTNWKMNQLLNYTKVYFRRFRRETTHYLVNISGLTLGFMVFYFSLIYVLDERSIDGYHTKADRIFRVIEKSQEDDGNHHYSAVSNALGSALANEYPEIESRANLFYIGSSSLKKGDVHFTERNYAITDRKIFDILDFELVSGDPRRDFSGELAVVLSQSTATRLFGAENPVGQVLEISDMSTTVEVMAVMEDMPKNSSYQFNALYLANFHLWGEGWNRWLTSWERRDMTTLVLLQEGTSSESILAKKANLLEKYLEEPVRKKHDFYFQPISEMHLHSTNLESSSREPIMAIAYSNNQFLVVILLIGLVVLVLAALNFINLSSVQALKRAKEAAIRKVNGATTGQLQVQLFVETFITLGLATLLAFICMGICYDWMMQISGKSIPFGHFFTRELIQTITGVFVVIWILSSLIPALYFSRLSRASLAIKSAFAGRGDLLRKAFITTQYAISLTLIIGSLVIYRQLNYISTKDLGFKMDQLLTLDINSGTARKNAELIKRELEESPDILSASTSSRVPGEWKDIEMATLALVQNEPILNAYHYAADEKWLKTYEMELKMGRNFTGQGHSDSLKVLLNETAVNRLGLTDPIGQELWVATDSLMKMEVVGVIRDFHFESLHKQMEPVFITQTNNPIESIDYFTIKYTGNLPEVLSHIESVQQRFDPLTPPEINFLNDKWARYYKADQSRSNLILIATIISILISSFGLFGLVNFTAERKTKEIGIRKVMGASVPSILRLILRDYVLLLVIALIIAVPLAFWFLSSWLNGFAYRIELHPGFIGIAFGLIALVSFLTVFFKVRKLAESNPISALRTE